MVEAWAGDNKFKGLVFLVLALAGVALLAYTYNAYTETQHAGGRVSTISVTGKSETFVKPDIATFTFSARAEEKTATAAQEKSAAAINTITAFLKEKGIEEKDIKTIGYDLQPKHEYTPVACTSFGMCPPGKDTIVGYTVDQTISVKVRKIEEAGNLTGGIGEKGATNVSGLTFTVDDPEVARAQVREEAIVDAKAKAEKLADSLGVRLVKLTDYYENGDMPVPYAYGGVANMEKSMDSVMVAPQISAGENEIISSVTLVYEIR